MSVANVATLPVDEQLALLWRLLFALHGGVEDFARMRIAAPASLKSAFDIEVVIQPGAIVVTLTPLP